MLGADGSYRWISSRGRADFTEDGKPRRMIGVHIDITEQKERHDQLALARRQLESHAAQLEAINRALSNSNEELEQFAYVASHDLQEPLRKVSSFCALLEEEYGDAIDGDGKTYINFIVDGAKRMQTLIRDLLTFSRVKSQCQPLQESSSDEAFRMALMNLQQAIEDSNAQVTSDPLPTVWADPSQLVQLFQNLVGNAIKYNQSDRPAVHIAIAERQQCYVVSVEDNGIGVAPEYHDRIFGIFKRLHGKDDYQGTGIGLAICKRILERWAQEIWVESDGVEGSTFAFTVSKVEYEAAGDRVEPHAFVHSPASTRIEAIR